MPLTIYGKPGNTSTLLSLMGRHYSCTFNFRLPGLSLLFLRLCVLPIYGFILWLFFFRVAATQTSFHTKNGLFFSLMAGISFIASSITALAYGPHRTRGYQEHREGGPSARVQAIAFTLSSIPLSLVSVFAGSAIVYWGCGLEDDLLKWVLFSAALWAMYGFVEQQTLAIMLIVKCSFNAILVSFHFIIVYMAIASGTVRTLLGLPTWLYYLSYVIIYRYTGAFLFENEFHRDSFPLLPANSNFTGTATCTEDDIGLKLGCRYSNGTDFLQEKYHFPSPNQSLDDLNLYLNFGLGFAFYVGMIIVNLLIYSVPLPAFLKTKFRD